MTRRSLAALVEDLSNYNKKKKCGAGAFSAVYLFEPKDGEGPKLAVKRMDKALEDPTTQTMFFREITILSTLQHPAILPFVGFNVSGKNRPSFDIITQYMPNGTVQAYEEFEAEGRLNPNWNATCKMKVIFGVASGMAFVHKCHIIHRDLKAENIFLNDEWEPVIADFGLSKSVDQLQVMQMSGVMGTPFYMAPELFTTDAGTSPSYPIDVYAYGVIVLSLFTKGNFTLSGKRVTSLPQLARALADGVRFDIPTNLEGWCRDLIQQCWHSNPDHRTTFEDIVQALKDDKNKILERADPDSYFAYRDRLPCFDGGSVETRDQGSAQKDEDPTPPFNFD
jgi:serine/threonine protein kinase